MIDYEEDEVGDNLIEQYCEIYNEIARRPDGERELLRAIELLKTIANAPVREDSIEFPRELAL
jgi:hypothetical protein